MIFEEEQQGEDRTAYGSFLIKSISEEFQPQFGTGFTIRQLEMNRQFYRTFPNTNALRSQFNWTHYSAQEDELIDRIATTSNELIFGNSQVGTDPKIDFKSKGPYIHIPPPNNVKFFFIYHKPERYTAVKAIYKYFLNGFQGKWSFPSMQRYIRQPFVLDSAENSIAYDTLETAMDTVKKAIRNKEKQPDTKYFAIFINPVTKYT